jgi:methionyl aminopeptidase
VREVPAEIERPPYVTAGRVDRQRSPRLVRTPDEIERMRRTGRAAREVLEYAMSLAVPGVTTEEIDAKVHAKVIELNAYPSPLMYGGPDNPYPKSLCTSVNEVICHGIPDDSVLRDGDIVNLDITIFREGVHGDCSETVMVGEVDEQSRKLVEVTRECLHRGIAAVRPGLPISVVGKAIEDHATANGFGVVRAFVGHGIGTEFHTEPNVLHYYDPSARFVIEEGMTFTIEPMITVGNWRHRMWDDGWTAVTSDLQRTAQFEHTLLVRSDRAEILTTR